MNEEENELILAQDKAQDKAQDEIVNEKISNMNEEEIKAIEKLDYELTYSWVHNQGISKETLKSFKDIIEKQQKEIENYQILKDDIEGHNIVYVDTPEFEEKYISKDKIKEKIDLIDKEYAEIIEKNKNDLYLVNINAQRHNAMQLILEELLGEC